MPTLLKSPVRRKAENEKRKTYNFSLDPKAAEVLRLLSEKERRSMSSTVEVAVLKYAAELGIELPKDADES